MVAEGAVVNFNFVCEGVGTSRVIEKPLVNILGRERKIFTHEDAEYKQMIYDVWHGFDTEDAKPYTGLYGTKEKLKNKFMSWTGAYIDFPKLEYHLEFLDFEPEELAELSDNAQRCGKTKTVDAINAFKPQALEDQKLHNNAILQSKRETQEQERQASIGRIVEDVKQEEYKTDPLEIPTSLRFNVG